MIIKIRNTFFIPLLEQEPGKEIDFGNGSVSGL
jgi:hypothetical protein